MFDFVRKHTKIMMFVMFLLIIPSFVLFGIDGYNRDSGKSGAVARVGGHEITQGEWDAAHKSESDRLRTSMPNLDAKLLDSPEARYATLERLVQERVLEQAAEKSKLITSDARLARDLQENPTIASLRLPDGKLDMDRYRQLAASQGMTPEGFEARVRQDLSTRQVQVGVIATGFSGTKVAEVSLNSFFEKREIQVANFVPADFASKVTPDGAALESFYKANQSMFQAPEQASIEYLVLDLESVKKSISLSEVDLKSYYDQNAVRLSGKEERRASHILINSSKDATEVDRQKAKVKADELLQIVRKSPESFAEVAKTNSQDTGSASNGGDLDFFARGAMVKQFEDAAFAMKKGDISEVVVSDFGFHIIKLTDIKTPKQRSFEELRPSIEADMKAQQAQRKFAEAAEAFTNGVYEQSDSLKPIADRLKLDVRTATNISRNPAPGSSGMVSNPKFLTAIFSSDAIENKRNTEAIETAPNQLAAARITYYIPARTLPFTEVRSIVRDRVVAARTAELAKKEGLEKLSAWRIAPATAAMPPAIVVSRDQSQNINPRILAAALRAPVSVAPVFIGVDLEGRGYAVVKVNKAMLRQEPSATTAQKDVAQYERWWTSAENQAYYKLLQDRFKVEILTARPNQSSIDLQIGTNK
jgi:peptidyl-prolyl cis-trans isomerase D